MEKEEEEEGLVLNRERSLAGGNLGLSIFSRMEGGKGRLKSVGLGVPDNTTTTGSILQRKLSWHYAPSTLIPNRGNQPPSLPNYPSF